MKLTETIYSILLKEYSEGVMRRLIDKFKTEQNNLSDAVIISYINDFKKISQKLENRDIMTYSWKDLENAVDSNRSTRIKAGKIDVTAEDANLLYNQDGVRIYHGKDKAACIKYSNGYSFCIGARGDNNLYSSYRYYDDTLKERVGTPYFVFNDNLDKEDRNHILVIFEFSLNNKHSPFPHFSPSHYTVTNANNSGDERFENFNSITTKYPWVAPLKDLMIENKGLTYDEREFRRLIHNQESKAYLLGREFLDKYSVNDIKRDFFQKLFYYVFEPLDPWFNPKQTPREKYDAMMKGMDVYKCKLDRHSMQQDYINDGVYDENIREVLKKVNDEFTSFYIIGNPEDFTPAAVDYAKKNVMPWIQQEFEGIEGESYNVLLKYVVKALDSTKKLHIDLQQLSAVTLGSRQANIDLEELIREYDKIDLIKKKYQHLA
jgi:uncharacterized protein YlaI